MLEVPKLRCHPKPVVCLVFVTKTLKVPRLWMEGCTVGLAGPTDRGEWKVPASLRLVFRSLQSGRKEPVMKGPGRSCFQALSGYHLSMDAAGAHGRDQPALAPNLKRG